MENRKINLLKVYQNKNTKVAFSHSKQTEISSFRHNDETIKNSKAEELTLFLFSDCLYENFKESFISMCKDKAYPLHVKNRKKYIEIVNVFKKQWERVVVEIGDRLFSGYYITVENIFTHVGVTKELRKHQKHNFIHNS